MIDSHEHKEYSQIISILSKPMSPEDLEKYKQYKAAIDAAHEVMMANILSHPQTRVKPSRWNIIKGRISDAWAVLLGRVNIWDE